MSLKNVKILVVDDEKTICEILAASLEDEGALVKYVHSGQEALEAMADFKPAVMLLDVWMPGGLDGIDVLEKMAHLAQKPKVVVMSGHGTIDTAVKAVRLGAWDFVEKPISMEKILINLNNILSFSAQEQEKKTLLNELRESFSLVGGSAHIQQIKSLIMKFGATNSSYLLTGEEGVGKSLVARNIHYVSQRAGAPFVSLNCSALPEGLHKQEIWGDESGHSIGFMQVADGGTLFVKDIEKLSPDAQSELADYLREKDSARRFSVRLVCSTSVSLQEAVKAGSFREDLYIRVSALSLDLKPLSEHKEDIPDLVEHFSREYCRKSGVTTRAFNEEAMSMMMNHKWPGNILELKNFVERVHILSPNLKFDVYDVTYAGLAHGEEVHSFSGYGNFREARAQFEKDYLLAKISENEGNISKTSEAIGLERSYLHRKIKAYGIEVDHKK